MLTRRTFSLSSLAASTGLHAATGTEVVMAGGQDDADPRFAYAQELLSLALDKADFAHTITLRGKLTQQRQVRELELGHLDVGLLPWVGVTGAWRTRWRAVPVRFPLRRGLLGFRLLLARASEAQALGRLGTLAELQRQCSLGYGADWADLDQMRQCGFRVVPGAGYSLLFRMLEQGRCDLLSRGLSEVWDELANPQLAGPKLAVVPNIALVYPLDDYLWVNPAKPGLHAAITRGLTVARADGSFARLFEKTFGTALHRAELGKRKLWPLLQYSAPADAPWSLVDLLKLGPKVAAWGSAA